MAGRCSSSSRPGGAPLPAVCRRTGTVWQSTGRPGFYGPSAALRNPYRTGRAKRSRSPSERGEGNPPRAVAWRTAGERAATRRELEAFRGSGALKIRNVREQFGRAVLILEQRPSTVSPMTDATHPPERELPEQRTCERDGCGRPVPESLGTRPRRYCGRSCRQRAYEARKQREVIVAAIAAAVLRERTSRDVVPPARATSRDAMPAVPAPAPRAAPARSAGS